MSEVVLINLNYVVDRMYEKECSKQNDFNRKKIDTLYQKTYQYYYDLFQWSSPSGIVDCPDFLYEQQRRRMSEFSSKAILLEIISDKRIDECYKKIRSSKLSKWLK